MFPASAILAACYSSVLPALGSDEKRAIQFFRVLRLIPSSLAVEASEARSVFSYNATASRLNFSVWVFRGVVEFYLLSPAQ